MTAPDPVVDPAPVDPPPNPAPPAPQPPNPAPAPVPAPPKKSLEDNLAGLDPDARAFVLGEVTKARNEAQGLRQRVKDSDPAKVKTELLSEISKAFGLTEAEPDPAALTAQIAEATATARQAQVELAVYRASVAANGDPTALLDSRSFLTTLATVDPTDDAAVTAAITAAVAANPALGTTPVRGLPRPIPAGGPPPGIDDQIAAAKKAGDVKTWMHLENQKLTAPGR